MTRMLLTIKNNDILKDPMCSHALMIQANFARIASKWRDDGGFLNPDVPQYRMGKRLRTCDLVSVSEYW